MTTLFNRSRYTKLRKTLRKEMPKGEKILWSRLRGSQTGWRFRRQYSIGKYVADFYCPELKLVVEVDGITHQHEEQSNKDTLRDVFFCSRGLIVKRYTSEQVFLDLDAVVQDIINTCESLPSLRPHPTSPC